MLQSTFKSTVAEYHINISTDDIYRYIGNGKRPIIESEQQAKGKRSIIEGEKLYKAKHVVRIGVTRHNGTFFCVISQKKNHTRSRLTWLKVPQINGTASVPAKLGLEENVNI